MFLGEQRQVARHKQAGAQGKRQQGGRRWGGGVGAGSPQGTHVLGCEAKGRGLCTELRGPEEGLSLPDRGEVSSVGLQGLVTVCWGGSLCGKWDPPTQRAPAGNRKRCSGNTSMFCGILIGLHSQTHLENSGLSKVQQISFLKAFPEPSTH